MWTCTGIKKGGLNMEDFKIKNYSQQFNGRDLYICKKDGKLCEQLNSGCD